MPVPEQGKIEGQVLIEGQGVSRPVVAFTHDLQLLDDGFGGQYYGRVVVADTISAPDGSYTLQFDYTGEVVVVALPDYGQVWQPSTHYDPGDRIRPTIGKETGYVYECTLPGDSAATEPVWWIDTGGGTLGLVGTATFKAVESWWPVTHAPIRPDIVVLAYSNLRYNHTQDPYAASVVSLVNFDGNPSDPIVDEIAGNTWTLHGDADQDGASALVVDGDGDYVQHQDSQAFRDEFNGNASTKWTIELGVVLDQVLTDTQILDWRPDTGQKGLNLVQPASDPRKVKLEAGNSSPTAYEVEVESSENYIAGQIVEIAITRNGDDYLLHCRGIYAGKASTPLSLDLGTGGLRLGEGRNPSLINGFDGKIVRFRATAGIARYQEKNYLVEGDTTSYAWLVSALLNGNFASGDLTHWVTNTGLVRVASTAHDPLDIGNTSGFYGGSNNNGGVIYNEFTVPSNALMADLSCYLERTNDDNDQAGVGLAFYDIFGDWIPGWGQCHVTEGSGTEESWYKAAKCLVPPNAHTARAWAWVGRPAAANLNAGGDSIAVRWLTGDYFPPLTEVPFLNADFWKGTFADWTILTGAPFIETNSSEAFTSIYAARSPNGSSSSFSQEAVIPAGPWKHAILRFHGSCSAYQRDNAQCLFIFKDNQDNPIQIHRLFGARGANIRMTTSEVVTVPNGAYSIEAVVDIILEDGSVVSAGVGGVKVEMVDPLIELEAVIEA